LFTYDNPFKVPQTNVTPDPAEAPDDDQARAEAQFRDSLSALDSKNQIEKVDFGRDEAVKKQAVNAEEQAQAERSAEAARIAGAQSEPSTPEKKADPVEPERTAESVFAERAHKPKPAEAPSSAKSKETIARLNAAADAGGKPDLGAHVDVKV
jgi:hypothetical protein